ncbi:DUF4412 domain-containing protein [Thioalkalivibrio sp. XN8]|uniref:DUF4412 domain-containing protein n=1 Tax=Thioalkalivibrio sp. XN8 TaxID=2712863 RepID=UPI0013EE3603|nr:DUF4412 domain-containing protein [Thioalkalivibrio sp. XN8]NGP54450.1 DUF4412 domain-containing protein [Thioalkalivibrio sp. XN8]
MSSTLSRRMAPFCVLTLLAAPLALGDTLMVIREGSGPADDGATTVQFWSGRDRVARIDGNGRMIGDLAAGMLYIVNDEAKTCHAMSTRNPDRDLHALQAAVEAVRFRNTGKSEAIGPWQAEVHELTDSNSGIDMVVWITSEFGVDPAQRAYMESVVTPDSAAMLAIYDLGGFPVRSEIQMGPIQMWTELESIEQKAAPAGTYEVPAGYSGCD